MTLTALRGRLMLFGGSGTSAKCFNDLQILDRQEMVWLDVTQCDSEKNPSSSDSFDTDNALIFRFGGDYSYNNSGNGSAPPEESGNSNRFRDADRFASEDNWRNTPMRRLDSGMQSMHVSPNPNDEDTVPTVLMHGRGPGRRAGHTATAVNRKIYIFGGSCGKR